jgi:hypothetical protein
VVAEKSKMKTGKNNNKMSRTTTISLR